MCVCVYFVADLSLFSCAGKAYLVEPMSAKILEVGMMRVLPILLKLWKNIIWLVIGALAIKTISFSSMADWRQSARVLSGLKIFHGLIYFFVGGISLKKFSQLYARIVGIVDGEENRIGFRMM